MKMKYVGQSIQRKEGMAKVTGAAQYIDDMHMPEMIYGATVRSTRARAKIKEIKFSKNIPWNEFTIVTAKDIPGKNYVALILNDQPFLADQITNHPHEPIVLLAHPDKYLLEKARQSVEIIYEDLPAVFTLQDSFAKKEVVWGDNNIFKKYSIHKGDVDAVWKTAAHIVEGEYFTGAQEQLYIENNGMIAVANPEQGITVWGSLQCPYYVHKALMPLFNLPAEKIRVVQAVTGGGFGGKEEYPSLLAGHAALLAWKAKKPVKIIYDRAEDMAATTKRHPSRTRHKTAVDKNGKLLAMDMEFILDGGAYATLSSVVLSRGTLHASGSYHCENIRIHSYAMATNAPPHGAFRGFGAPQSVFAIERHMDKIADTLGIAREEIRRINFLQDGLKTTTGQVIQDGVDQNAIMQNAFQKINYHEKIKKFAKENVNSPIKKGIGFATFFHGAGFTGSGERMMASVASVGATEEGLVRVFASSTEIGQGTNTIFSQIVGDALNIPYEQIEVVQPDTSLVPNSGPTVASRTVMVVGKLVEQAATSLKQTLQQAGFLADKYSYQEFAQACKKYHEKIGPLKIFSEYKQPPHVEWNDEKYEGVAYGTYAWACYAAEVEVDTRTYLTQVKQFVALQEVGKVVNPIMAAGQIEGGVAQGIGFAIYENVVWQNGEMKNNQMTNYIMPTSADIPDIHVEFFEKPYAYGPQGAKGIGELPLDGAAPAVISAIENALKDFSASSSQPARAQLNICHIPFMPEDCFQFLKDSK